MRNCLWLLVLLSACNSTTSPDKAAPTVAPLVVADAEVATIPTGKPSPMPTKADPPPAAEEKLSWMLLIDETDELTAQWKSLPEDKRLAYYQEWSSRTQAMTAKLIENMDGKELTRLETEGKLKNSVRTVKAEGFFVGMYVSEAWLLKQFPTLPKQERDYLKWVIDADEESWFAEGDLQVEISVIKKAYVAGAKISKSNSDGFRAPIIKAKLDGFFFSIIGLLTHKPEGKAGKRYAREVGALFRVVASSDIHKAEATAIIRKLPAKGIPYAYDVVDEVKESLGMME